MVFKVSKAYVFFIISICLFSCNKDLDESVIISQNDENAITSFNLLQADNSIVTDGDRSGIINQENRTIDFIFPFETDITAVTPVITISEGATISPASGIVQDFTTPVTYTVTAENGSEQNYTVTIVLPELSERAALLEMYDPSLFDEEDRWDLSATDINTWTGVTAVEGRVIGLDSEVDREINITSAIENLIHLEFISFLEVSVDLPEELGNIPSLKRVNFELSSISDGGLQPIENLTNLETLTFEGSGRAIDIESLDFSNLKKLTSLSINANNISSLSDSVNELTSLITLDLEENNISVLPDLSDLTNLETLDLTNNSLTELPTNLSDLTSLKDLRLSDNDIVDISSITQLTALETISLSSNKINTIPTDLDNLTNLISLSLSNNDITIIPTEIGRVTTLTTLFLSSNNIETIPTEIGDLTNLTTLSFFNNTIAVVPIQIGNLTNLTSLTLSNNAITRIPTQIGSLINLKSLIFSNNLITAIPSSIGELAELTTLSLNGNRIENIGVPEELGRLIGLFTLDLRTNPLTVVPISVCNLRNTATNVRLEVGVTCD